MKYKVCFLGGTRYTYPLDPTTAKKFSAMSCLGELYVVAFSANGKSEHYHETVSFLLLPTPSSSVLRYAYIFLLGLPVVLRCIFYHHVNILVTQSPYEGAIGAIAKLVARLVGRRIALVVESHGNFETSLFMQKNVPFPKLVSAFMKVAAAFGLKHADLLRSISSMTSKQISAWSPGKQQVQFVTWTDMDVFLDAGSKKGDRDGQKILYAGVLIPRKGVHHLINAFASIVSDFPKAELIIVGSPENIEYTNELKSLVYAHNIDRRVKFQTMQSQTDLAVLMHQACVFVLPSIAEGLGRVVFEAMATGTAVIGSNVDGIPDMIKDGYNGFLVSPGNEEDLAARLRWVLLNPDEVIAMGQRARDFAEQFFSSENYVKGYEQLFAKATELLPGRVQ